MPGPKETETKWSYQKERPTRLQGFPRFQLVSNQLLEHPQSRVSFWLPRPEPNQRSLLIIGGLEEGYGIFLKKPNITWELAIISGETVLDGREEPTQMPNGSYQSPTVPFGHDSFYFQRALVYDLPLLNPSSENHLRVRAIAYQCGRVNMS